MSYQIAKSIKKVSTSDGEKFRIECRSNNVWPADYTTLEFPAEGYATLYKYIKEGTLRPIDSANNYKWAYFRERIDEGSCDFSAFRALVDEKQPSGSYAIKVEGRGYVYKMTTSRVSWVQDKYAAKPFNYYEAFVKAKRLENCGFGANVVRVTD